MKTTGSTLLLNANRVNSLFERKKICGMHLNELCRYYGEKIGVVQMRKVLSKYFPSCKNVRDLNRYMQTINCREDVIDLLDYIHDDETGYYYCQAR